MRILTGKLSKGASSRCQNKGSVACKSSQASCSGGCCLFWGSTRPWLEDAADADDVRSADGVMR